MSPTTVAFFAGLLVGSLLSMFMLALFIAGSEGHREGRATAETEDSFESPGSERLSRDSSDPDIIPIDSALQRAGGMARW